MKTRPRARPRFTLQVPHAPDVITERVRKHLAAEPRVTGAVSRRTVTLRVREEDTHFWSPHLDIQLQEDDAGGTQLSAMFAPHPSIWSTFVAIQALFALLSVGAGVWVASALTLAQSITVPLITLGVMLFGGGFAYGAAYVGQGIGSEQMYELRAFLDAALRDEE
jgi:hypothetical protein